MSATTDVALAYKPGDLVRARAREWVVLPEPREDLLRLRPLGGSDDDATVIYLPLEPERPVSAVFAPPDPNKPGSQAAALLFRDALRLKLRSGAGPFRSFGNLNFEPRAYQLVPLMMALKMDVVRLLVADDVGIGKTIEAGLIARELLDRGEIDRLAVICPPHLCEQWKLELADKFAIDAEIVRTGTTSRLERGLRVDESIFEVHPFTVVSLDYIKLDTRRGEFQRACPDFVIVDEAHTCVQSNTTTRHQRYDLLKGLAESKPRRGMVLLTATPHSGDDTAFHNLLGLLDSEFGDLLELPEGEQRRLLRDKLALHFVQRRRGDIAEWKDSTSFPARENREATYRITGEFGQLFEDILAYAKALVRRAEGETVLRQRMSWWAALALLRCASSSPAAASLALRTRLRATEGETECEQVERLHQEASEAVLDQTADDSLTLAESVPAGTVEKAEDAPELRRLIAQAGALRGPGNDPKLKTLVDEIRDLLRHGFRPVVFCRYIASAQYVGKALHSALVGTEAHVLVITGEISSIQRQERVEELSELESGVVPVLVATDCLSEGINLQSHFNAVVHYDLTWNPTRHEQREGRADRFGQRSTTVRALMLYGEDNPVDGAVLRVILRKAEKIRKELGVSVPLPVDNHKAIDAIMRAVLIDGGGSGAVSRRALDLGLIEDDVDRAWKTASNKMTRTVFAQQRLRPDDVLPEWQKAASVLGGPKDVARFVRVAAEHLGAPLDERGGYFRFPVTHCPRPLQDRLNAVGFTDSSRIAFAQRAPAGAIVVHRAHPLVAALADYVAEQALDADDPKIGARGGAIFTREVRVRTELYLLRLRSQLRVQWRAPDGRWSVLKSMLAEECVAAASRGPGTAELLSDDEALSLLSLEPGRNMPDGQKTYFLQQAVGELPGLEEAFSGFARQRAGQLWEDHRRVRGASDARGLRYEVIPAREIDKVGIYVFVPLAGE